MKKLFATVMALAMSAGLPCYAAEAVQSPGPTPPSGDTSNIGVWVAVLVVALIGLAVTTVLFLRSKKNA